MTYCVAMNLQQGLIFASDSRTNAGVDHIACFRKMKLYQQPGERLIVVLSAGNLATTQSVHSLMEQRIKDACHDNLLSLSSMYDVACLLGRTLREIQQRDLAGQMSSGVDFGASLIVGGQIRGERPRLFNIYAQGNFIESTEDTPYFQIGESKYGKPILDRVVNYQTDLLEAAKCILISFDSTIRSNLSVGLPIDLLWCRQDEFQVGLQHRIGRDDPYFSQLSQAWSEGLHQVFRLLPDPWSAPQTSAAEAEQS